MESAQTILEIKGLELAFSARFFNQSSIRETFISAVSSPFSFLANRNRTRNVLRNLNLQIKRGDRIALIGVNGSGKTSLCRCIAGTLIPNRGQINSSVTPRVIMQTEAFFFPELTGAENASLLTEFLYQDLSASEKKEVVKEALHFSGLEKYVHTPIETYSMGMKSRLSLSLATARPQELLVLDEVYTHADEFFQSKIEDRLAQQIKGSGSVLVVSHYEKDLIQLCNRGIVLHEGEIKYDGTVETALKAYRFMNGGAA